MLDSIERVGLLQPLIVWQAEGDVFVDENASFTETAVFILAGNTRREAWWQLYLAGRIKKQWIPCQFVRATPLEAQRLVVESNRQRVKTKEQEAREFEELLRIETDLAAEKQKQHGNTAPGRKNTSGKISSSVDREPQARDKAAEHISMSALTAEKLLEVVHKADSGDAVARAALDAVNEGKSSVAAAHRVVVQTEIPVPTQQPKAKPPQDAMTRWRKLHAAIGGIYRDVPHDQREAEIYWACLRVLGSWCSGSDPKPEELNKCHEAARRAGEIADETIWPEKYFAYQCRLKTADPVEHGLRVVKDPDGTYNVGDESFRTHKKATEYLNSRWHYEKRGDKWVVIRPGGEVDRTFNDWVMAQEHVTTHVVLNTDVCPPMINIKTGEEVSWETIEKEQDAAK